MIRLAVCAALAALGIAAAEAKPFKLATSIDAATLDPHANNSASTSLLLVQIYEPLINRNADLKLEPCLALSWEQVEPSRWRFRLRDGVRFAGGESFDAEDVAFSIRRALAPTSTFGIYVDTVADAVVVDRLTVDVVTRVPDAVIPDKLSRVPIMDKGWAEANKAERPQNFREKEETHTARHANGTGPFILRSRENDQRTVLVRNPAWWGGETSVTEYHHVVISSDATRVAALLSGEVDLVLFVPAQDVERLKRQPQIRVLEGMENRTVMIGMDQRREELTTSDVKGRNPFKDVRVRRAMAQAIDMETIRTRTLRGQAVPTGAMWTRYVNGWEEAMEARPAMDRDRARALLAEAGYPAGFEVGMDCPVGPYDEACQSVAAMLSQIGVRVKLATMPNAQFIQKVSRGESSMYGLSWGVPTFDALYTLRAVMASRDMAGASSWNHGGYSNPELDRLVRAVEAEIDAEARRGLIRAAHRIHAEDVGHIPLYHVMTPWAMRAGVRIQHRADNQPLAKDVTVE